MQQRFLSCLASSGFHRLAYLEWPGPPGARTLVCVHGLTRNSRDFLPLAEALSAYYRVICPDMAGRGLSDNLPDPALYAFPTYLADVTALIARLDVESVDWLGTSMGGILGMMMAAQPGTPIRRLVLNDVGAVVAKAGLERIAGYVGLDPAFDTLDELADAMAAGFVGSAKLPRGVLREIAQGASRLRPDGRLGLAYDPRIGDALRAAPPQEVDLFAIWDRISCPTLAVRGGVSDLFTPGTAEAMTRRGPKAKILEIPGVGHAPWLATPDEIAPVADFLRSPQ